MFYRKKTLVMKEEDRLEFIQYVNESIDQLGYTVIMNDYPYNMYAGKECKTEHYTMWYKKLRTKELNEINEWIAKGYYVIISNVKSIPEINHLHFIKKI